MAKEPDSSEIEYSPRGFFFWSLAPFLLLFIVVMGAAFFSGVISQTVEAMLTLTMVEAIACLALLGLFNPARFWWAWRGVGALVFAAFVAYLVSTLVESGGNIEMPRRRSESSPVNAFIGLLVFGLPGLWYALFGRLTMFEEAHSNPIRTRTMRRLEL